MVQHWARVRVSWSIGYATRLEGAQELSRVTVRRWVRGMGLGLRRESVLDSSLYRFHSLVPAAR